MRGQAARYHLYLLHSLFGVVQHHQQRQSMMQM
jgi:hypothetical protein